MIEVYADYHTPTVVYAKDNDGWWIVPSTAGGWKDRREWNPSPLYEKRLCTDANRVTFYGQSWLAETWYGMPADQVAAVKPA